MSDSDKIKQRKSKFFKIFRAVIIAIAAIATVFVLVFWILFKDAIKMFIVSSTDAKESYPIVEIAMTPEERLEDFEEVYNLAVLSNPNSPEFEKLYGICFEEMYNEYRGYVEECETDFDYIFVLFTYLRNIPSGHTTLSLADPGKIRSSGFEMCDKWAGDNEVNSYLYSWEKYIEKELIKYDLDNTETHSFLYYDGDYVLATTDDPDYGALLLEVNGQKPLDKALDPLQYYKLNYDDVNNNPYRNTIMYNDKYGEPVTLKMKLLSGEIVEKEAFLDEKLNFCMEMDLNYKNNDSAYKAERTDDSTTGESSRPAGSSKHYTIYEDTENNLVYVGLKSCDTAGMDTFKDELSSALENYDNVILDLRGNPGGKTIFCQEYLYPCLFKDDLEYTEDIEVGLNNSTLMWAKSTSNKIMYNAKINDTSIKYTNSTSYTGSANKDFNIYVLTNEGTFSSADITAGILGSKENVTLVGTNSGGEGFDGMIFTGKLPNSHLIVCFSPGRNVNVSPANSVYGWAPDVVCPLNADAIRSGIQEYGREKMTDYENRRNWDNTIIKTIELIKCQ